MHHVYYMLSQIPLKRTLQFVHVLSLFGLVSVHCIIAMHCNVKEYCWMKSVKCLYKRIKQEECYQASLCNAYCVKMALVGLSLTTCVSYNYL